MAIYDVVFGFPKDLDALGMITYAICEDGVYLIKKSGCGSVVLKVEGLAGSGKGPGKNFNTILPRKIPFSIYYKTVEFFREVIKKGGEKSLEAFVLVLYNKDTDDFQMYVPTHNVSGGSVKYDLKDVWDRFKGYTVVLDIHSHHDMGAYFSSVDDKDDNRDRYSGVIGKISKLIPEFAVRFSSMGEHWLVDLEDIFVQSDEDIEFDLEDALTRVIIVAPKITSGWGSTRVTRSFLDPHSRSSSLSYNGLFSGFRTMANRGRGIHDIPNGDVWDDLEDYEDSPWKEGNK